MTIRELESLHANLTPSSGDAFIGAVREADSDPEVSPILLRGFLDKIIDGFVSEGHRICAAGELMSQDDRDALTLYGRIIAAEILILHKMRSTVGLRDRILLFLEYASAIVRTKYDFLTTALDVVCYKVTSPGVDWSVIQKAASLDLLSYKLITNIGFDKTTSESFSYRGRGRVECRDGKLAISSSEVVEAGAKAFSICGDRVSIYTRNNRDEKLKNTDQNNAQALRAFADTFIGVQEESAFSRSETRELQDGDKVAIRVIGYDQDEALECVVMDGGGLEKGTLVNEELIKGIWTEDIVPYLCESDCIEGAVLYRDPDRNRFSIANAYTEFARRRAEKDWRENVVFKAKVYNVDTEPGRVNWMTPAGYGGITKLEDTPGVKVGDIAVLQVISVHKQGPATYVNLCSPRYEYESVVPFDEDQVLLEFLTKEADIERRRKEARQQELEKGKGTIEVLRTILSSTASRGSSMEAYRLLLVALFLSGTMDDQEEVALLRGRASYMGQCLSFAQGDGVRLARDMQLPEEESAILRLLSQWGAPGNELREELLRWDGSSIPGKVAGLMYGVQVSETFRDEVKADREMVRKKICDLIGVGDSFEAEGAMKKGKYGLVEGHEVEFKSSYVFRNDGKGADLDYQGRGQVFEAVCAFLNADGGVLYLGVTDAGEPILAKDYGLSADMTWLTEHYQLINQSRIQKLGHAVFKADDLDHYVLFLNAEKELYFKESLQGNITIEVTDDADAIRITVAPAEYELAYLYSDKTRSDGVAYVRDGGRTVPMSWVQKEQRLASLKRITKEMDFLVTIHEAIDKRRRIIFKDYASGNSGEVKDRYVVPVNLYYNDENVYCFDLESKEYKQFRLHRIGSIEYAEDSSPYPLPVSEPRRADVFRWLFTEQRPYHIRLRMHVRAKNYFLEEYSCAEKLPKEEFYQEGKDTWILDTHVSGLGAVRRFYLGLADQIEILDTEDSEELKKDIADYIGEHIK